MSKTKKIISLLLTVVLVITMATVAIVTSSALTGDEIYVVVGNAGLCTSEWDPTDTANNQMAWNAEKNVFEKVYTGIAAGTYEFKVLEGTEWGNPDYNFEGVANSTGNAILNVENDNSTVTIIFNGSYVEADVTTDDLTDDPVDTPTDAPVVDDPTDAPVVDGDTITVYFTNNWMLITPSVYYWGTGADPAWPGVAMTMVDTNEGGEDIYSAEIPANAAGIIFNGYNDQNPDQLRQTVDITDFTANTGYYCDIESTTEFLDDGSAKIVVASYDYPVDEDPTDAPVVDDPTSPDEDPTDAPVVDEKGVSIDGTVYPVSVGDTITYTATITAAELFEDVQAKITYDADKLELVETKSTEACPNIVSGLTFNAKNAGVVKFNAVYLDGYDFTTEKVLVTLTFNVKDDALSEIDLTIEEMTIITGESYFTNGEASKTEGITVTETAEDFIPPTPPTEPTTAPTEPTTAPTEPTTAPTEPTTAPTEPADDMGVKVNDDVYAVSVGDEITYVVYLEAEELFEDVQAIITYDADKLELLTTKSTEACPGLASGLTFNAKNPGEVKFNAVYLDGYDFTEEGIFVTLTFNVKDNALSEIDLVIEEMTIITGESYFTDSEPSKTEGITVREVLEVPEPPTTEPPTTEPPTTEPPTTAPTEPTTAPEQPTTAPEQPTTAPEQPTTAPEQPTTAPEQPTTAPDATSATGTNATDAPNAPGTGATAYIYVALAIVAMAAAAVVVLRKKANG